MSSGDKNGGQAGLSRLYHKLVEGEEMTYQIWVRVNGKQMLQTATNDRERARVQFVEQGGSDSIFKPCLVTIKPECEKAMFFDLKREDKVE